MLMECVFVLFLAFMMAVALWGLFGLLLLPVFGPNMITLLMAEGSGRELEIRVRAYNWLREQKKHGGKLVVVDCGLTRQGLEIVQRLKEERNWLEYCPYQSLGDYIELMQHCLENSKEM